MDKYFIAADGLSFSYPVQEDDGVSGGDTRPAVDGLTVSLERGSFTAILGRNGSGKSTFGKLINALLSPTGGTLTVGGLDVTDEKNIRAVRSSAGMVFQNPDNQIVAAVVEEDVAFGPENLGVPSAEIRRRVTESLAAVGMSEYADHPPHMLSGGQKQRVAIAGVLAMKTQCLILDEPTAMLDPIGRKEVLETARRLNRDEGITVLLVTHYMDEAVLADRVIIMDGGRVVRDGTPREAFSDVGEIKSLGLDVPIAADMADRLRRRGISLPRHILTTGELVAELSIIKEKD